jgi:glycosyltransferase involved in cell wall biosynthesis
MRIAHLIHGLGLGGAQQVIRFLVAARPPEDEHFVYSCHGGVFAAPIEAAGATVRIVPRLLPKLDPLWVVRLARQLRRDRIEVVHGHLFGDSLHGYFACRLAGLLPLVMTLHNSADARTGLQLRGYRYLLGGKTLPVACAEFVRQSFLDCHGPAAARLRTIANGIPDRPSAAARDEQRPELAQELGLPEDAVWLATLGRLAEQKAYDLLLEALARLPPETPDWRLVLLGDGPLRARLEAQATALGLAGKVKFAGFREDAASLLPAFDGVVFSSHFEGLPIALLEAMAAGKPVVATAVGGIPAALEDRSEALLLPPRDPQRLSAELGRLLADPELRRRLGAAARARFEKEFEAAAMARSYRQVYREALAARSAAGNRIGG